MYTVTTDVPALTALNLLTAFTSPLDFTPITVASSDNVYHFEPIWIVSVPLSLIVPL